MSALADVLSLEHEAVWTYGLIGGAFPGLRDAADAAFHAHRTERDRLLVLVADPVDPQATYEPATIADEADARIRAGSIEQRIAGVWARLIGSSDDRAAAIDSLHTAEAARLAWGGSPVAFPGLD